MNWKPAAKIALNLAIGAASMVGIQNTVPAVRNATLSQAGLTKSDLVDVINEVRKLPPTIIKTGTVIPVKVTTSQTLKELEKK